MTSSLSTAFFDNLSGGRTLKKMKDTGCLILWRGCLGYFLAPKLVEDPRDYEGCFLVKGDPTWCLRWAAMGEGILAFIFAHFCTFCVPIFHAKSFVCYFFQSFSNSALVWLEGKVGSGDTIPGDKCHCHGQFPPIDLGKHPPVAPFCGFQLFRPKLSVPSRCPLSAVPFVS